MSSPTEALDISNSLQLQPLKAETQPESKVRAKPRRWTEEEDTKFEDGLTKFGRDWKLVAEYIGTRDHKAVKSHAQKYFIKLYKEGKPLPDKVLESGDGYTVSGKTLDPNSATARAYGVQGNEEMKKYRYEKLARKLDLPYFLENNILSPGKVILEVSSKDGEMQKVEGNLTKEGKISVYGNLLNCKEFEAFAEKTYSVCIWEHAFINGVSFAKIAEDCAAKDPRKVSKIRKIPTPEEEEKKRQKLEEKEQKRIERERKKAEKEKKRNEKLAEKEQKRREKAAMYDDNGLTEYSRGRSRRRVRRDLTSKEDTLIPQFVEVGNYTSATQPFKVSVNKEVYLAVTVHSHLSANEIIGFLAGTWDAQKNVLLVSAAFPGRSTLEASTECELDPESAFELRDAIAKEGMSVVGWYHSHPTFEPTPSNWDVTNQKNYQSMFRDHKYGKEPFIGLIWSPFNYEVDGLVDNYKWFYVDAPLYLEKAMFSTVEEVSEAFNMNSVKFLRNFVESRYSFLENPIIFTDIFQQKEDGSMITYGRKLQESLDFRFPNFIKAFLQSKEENHSFDPVEFLTFLLKPKEIVNTTKIAVDSNASSCEKTSKS